MNKINCERLSETNHLQKPFYMKVFKFSFEAKMLQIQPRTSAVDMNASYDASWCRNTSCLKEKNEIHKKSPNYVIWMIRFLFFEVQKKPNVQYTRSSFQIWWRKHDQTILSLNITSQIHIPSTDENSICEYSAAWQTRPSLKCTILNELVLFRRIEKSILGK